MYRVRTLFAGMLVIAVGCGGSDGPTGPNAPNSPANGTFTARIDGTNWAATTITPAMAQPGGIASAIGAGDAQYTIAFAWIDEGPKTYAIGQSVGLNASLTSGLSHWVTSGAGSGTLVVNTRTANRVTGTFSFTVTSSAASATTGTRTITNGAFDVTF
jgi:hypothetical protein